jgi:hypothetical protein
VLKVTAAALAEVEDALTHYEQLVRDSRLSPTTQRTYLVHAENFVRWLRDDFEPGARLRYRRLGRL